MEITEEKKIEIMMKALEKVPIQAPCIVCGEVETIFEVDEPFDEIFLANYFCWNCDGGPYPPPGTP
jgi:hypothetical protein